MDDAGDFSSQEKETGAATAATAGGATGTVDISAEVIGHALKALLLPCRDEASYHPLHRDAAARRALALSPALFATMHHYRQYPIWPVTFLYFAAGGLADKGRGGLRGEGSALSSVPGVDGLLWVDPRARGDCL